MVESFWWAWAYQQPDLLIEQNRMTKGFWWAWAYKGGRVKTGHAAFIGSALAKTNAKAGWQFMKYL